MAVIAGIIAEYNPFHLGHQYHIEKTRQKTGADYIVIVMSGNFVQRGEPALFDQSRRARMALLSGADLVLELPLPFAAGSAEDFALGAVSLMEGLGCVKHLSFGSENGDTDILKEAAAILAEEPAPFREALKEKLRQGLPYPKARMEAMKICGISAECLDAIAEPNNLLGVEYLKALIRRKSGIKPVAVKRLGKGYHDLQLSDQGAFGDYASASAIRAAIRKELPAIRQQLTKNFPDSFSKEYPDNFSDNFSKKYPDNFPDNFSKKYPDNFPEELPNSFSKAFQENQLLSQIPDQLHSLYHPETLFPLYPDDFSALLNYRILDIAEKGGRFREFSDISPEMEGRLKKQALSFHSFSRRAAELKTRQYTYTRVSRGLLHILLDLRREDMDSFRKTGCTYARILGFKRQSAPLLRMINEAKTIPLIAKAADAPGILSGDALNLWNRDLYGSHLYLAAMRQIYGHIPAIRKEPENEYRRPLVIV